MWEYASYVPSMNFYTLRVSKLLEIDKTVPANEKIEAVVPIEKFCKGEIEFQGIQKEETSFKKQLNKKAKL